MKFSRKGMPQDYNLSLGETYLGRVYQVIPIAGEAWRAAPVNLLKTRRFKSDLLAEQYLAMLGLGLKLPLTVFATNAHYRPPKPPKPPKKLKAPVFTNDHIHRFSTVPINTIERLGRTKGWVDYALYLNGEDVGWVTRTIEEAGKPSQRDVWIASVIEGETPKKVVYGRWVTQVAAETALVEVSQGKFPTGGL